jgi:hypothetical protein
VRISVGEKKTKRDVLEEIRHIATTESLSVLGYKNAMEKIKKLAEQVLKVESDDFF